MRVSFEEYLNSFLPESDYRDVMLQLLTLYPDAVWHYTKYPDSKGNACLPYLKTEAGYFVECTVTAGNVTRSHLLPIIDEQGEVLLEGVNAYDVQSAHEACFVICASLFGIAAAEPVEPAADACEKESFPTHMEEHPPSDDIPQPAEIRTATNNVTEFKDVVKRHQSRNHYEIVNVTISEDPNPHFVIQLRNAEEEIEVHTAIEEVEQFESKYGNFSGTVKLDKEYVRVPDKGTFWLAKNFNKVS